MYYINGLKIPVPIEWSTTRQSVTTSNSGKVTLDGRMHNSIIRTRDVITVKFGMLTDAEAALLDTLLFAGNVIMASYPDRTPSGGNSKKFIVGAVSAAVKIIKDNATYWTGYAVTLTEV